MLTLKYYFKNSMRFNYIKLKSRNLLIGSRI